VGGGLGPLKGKVWRVGLMGYNASPRVFSLLEALDRVLLPRQGFKVPAGASLAAAERVSPLMRTDSCSTRYTRHVPRKPPGGFLCLHAQSANR